MHLQRRVLVVVEAGAAQLLVVEGEAERLDQVQARAGVRAQADHVAGVGRDLGLVQDHVEHAGPGGSPRERLAVLVEEAAAVDLVGASITPAAPATACAGVELGAPAPPMSVCTQPGCSASTTMPRSPSACASARWPCSARPC